MDEWLIPQDWNRYEPAEHALWDRLFARQVALLSTRAAPAFLEGIDVLRMSKPGIPDFEELSERLHAATGWTVAAVPGLLHGLERPPALERVAEAGHAAFCRYRPRVYAGAVTFVKAADEVRMPFDAKLLWGGLLSKLTIHLIPGDHWSLVKNNVGTLATVLSTAIRHAETKAAP